MRNVLKWFSLVLSISALAAATEYNGPYLFWGLPRLESLENSALNGLDEELLKDIYSEASAVIIFLKNASHPLASSHYPSLENLLADRKSAYMSQSVLIYDPTDLNQHTEVITLSGTPDQEDIELCALFRDAEINYGDRKVLGILANALPTELHRRRREAQEDSSTTEAPTSSTATPEATEDHIYYLPGKALFYTSDPPELNYSDRGLSLVLRKHLPITVDVRENYMRLSLKYVTADKGLIQCSFRIDLSGGYWTLVNVEITHDGKQATLPVLSKAPSAPLVPAYSYRCSRPLVFGNDNVTLTMQNIQVRTARRGGAEAARLNDQEVVITSASAWEWFGGHC